MTIAAEESRQWALAAAQPPPALTVWQWADGHRSLPSDNAEPGPYRSSRVPYWREVVECMGPGDPCREIVVMKGAQIGASTALAENVVGYYIEHDPCPIILVRPDIEDAEQVSKERFQPMFDSTPSLVPLVGNSEGRRKSSSTLRQKRYPGGTFTLIGAKTPTGLRSKAARILIFDEVDAYGLEAGKEGDPIALGVVRSRTFANRKAVMFSTPTARGRSRIESAYETSDKRHYHVPCPHCGAFQRLAWGDKHNQGGVKWDGVDAGSGVPVNVRYECKHCAVSIYEQHKEAMLEAGEWVAEYPDREVRGYHLSALYSPWLTWADAVAEFLAAGNDPAKLKPFVNTVLAETWDEDAQLSAKDEDLVALCERWWTTGDEVTVPAGAGLLTAGVDTQGDRLELVVRAWGVGEEAWTIDRRVLYGDPSGPAVWDDLERILTSTYPHESGTRLPIAAVGIDLGGHHRTEVLRFCEPRHARKVWAVKGIGIRPAPWPRRPGKAKNSTCPIYGVGVDPIKGREYARLRAALRLMHAGQSRTGGGMVHFPVAEWCDADYFRQLTAEVVRQKPSKGRYVEEWHLPNGRRNEVLDCHVYSYAVLHGLLLLGVKLDTAVATANAGPAKEATGPPRKMVGFNAGAPRLRR